MMTSAQVVETSVNVTSNSPSQDYTHPDDHNLPNYKVNIIFKDESNLPVAHSHEFCTPRTKNLLQSMNLELRKGKKRTVLQ